MRRGFLLRSGIALAVLGVVFWGASRFSPFYRRNNPADYVVDPEDADVAARIVAWGPRDCFQVIDEPRYLTAEEAGRSMSDREIVLGLKISDQIRAYPINYLNDHEMVEEEIGGVPLLVTW